MIYVYNIRRKFKGAYHVVPCARAIDIRALVARVHIDEYTAVTVEVGGALAVATAAVARERNLRACPRLEGTREDPERIVLRGRGRKEGKSE